MKGSACYPPPMKCSNCGKNKEYYIQHTNRCSATKVLLMNTNQPTHDNSDDNSDDDMLYGVYD